MTPGDITTDKMKTIHDKIGDAKNHIREAIKLLAEVIPSREFENLKESYRDRTLDSLTKLNDIISKL